jgi:hypothetical protein
MVNDYKFILKISEIFITANFELTIALIFIITILRLDESRRKKLLEGLLKISLLELGASPTKFSIQGTECCCNRRWKTPRRSHATPAFSSEMLLEPTSLC